MIDRPGIDVQQIRLRAENMTAEEGRLLGTRVRDLVARQLGDTRAERNLSRISVRVERRPGESIDTLAGRIASAIVAQIGQARTG